MIQSQMKETTQWKSLKVQTQLKYLKKDELFLHNADSSFLYINQHPIYRAKDTRIDLTLKEKHNDRSNLLVLLVRLYILTR